MMWATTPNREVFGQKEMVLGEFRGYTRFGGEFAELRRPRFSPYGGSAFAIAHFMRDTNPLKNDQGSRAQRLFAAVVPASVHSRAQRLSWFHRKRRGHRAGGTRGRQR